jgi:dTDP-4-amino-4,6-dideoxygalactose transaminase
VPRVMNLSSAHHLFVVILPRWASRDHVQQRLAADGVGTSVHFRPLHQFSWFSEHALKGPSGLNTAETLADRALSLPLYPDMTTAQVDYVCDALVSAVND